MTKRNLNLWWSGFIESSIYGDQNTEEVDVQKLPEASVHGDAGAAETETFVHGDSTIGDAGEDSFRFDCNQTNEVYMDSLLWPFFDNQDEIMIIEEIEVFNEAENDGEDEAEEMGSGCCLQRFKASTKKKNLKISKVFGWLHRLKHKQHRKTSLGSWKCFHNPTGGNRTGRRRQFGLITGGPLFRPVVPDLRSRRHIKYS